MEFAVISKNSIRNLYEVVDTEKTAIFDTLGIPKEHIFTNWDHMHYTDNGEAGPDSCIAALRRAKAAMRPARMAVAKIRMGLGACYSRPDQSGAGYTDGPTDDNLFAVLFKDTSGAAIGSWLRFSAHGIDKGGVLQQTMEQRFGGKCALMQGGGGNTGPGPLFTTDTVVNRVMRAEPGLTFETVDKMGVAWGMDANQAMGVPTLVQTTRIGGFYFPVYYAENPIEQDLYTGARTCFDSVVVIGYGNGRSSGNGGYYYWGNCSVPYGWDVFNNTEQTIRAVNILRRVMR